MKNFFIKWLINILALELVAHLVTGISLDKWQSVVWASLFLGLINAFLRPLIIIMTLPLNIFSLGFFTLLINGALFYLVSKIVKGFVVLDFWNAFWGSILFSIVSFLLSTLISKDKEKVGFRFYQGAGQQEKKYSDAIEVKAHVKDE